MVVKKLPKYLLQVHLQTRCRLGELKLKGVKCKSAKVRKWKKNNTPNPNYNPNPNPILTATLSWLPSREMSPRHLDTAMLDARFLCGSY